MQGSQLEQESWGKPSLGRNHSANASHEISCPCAHICRSSAEQRRSASSSFSRCWLSAWRGAYDFISCDRALRASGRSAVFGCKKTRYSKESEKTWRFARNRPHMFFIAVPSPSGRQKTLMWTWFLKVSGSGSSPNPGIWPARFFKNRSLPDFFRFLTVPRGYATRLRARSLLDEVRHRDQLVAVQHTAPVFVDAVEHRPCGVGQQPATFKKCGMTGIDSCHHSAIPNAERNLHLKHSLSPWTKRFGDKKILK